MWTPFTQVIHPNDIRMFKSLAHTTEEVNIQLRLKVLRMRCDGFYLRVSDFEGRTVSRIIPICVKAPNDSFPPSYLKHPTPAPSSRLDYFNRRLWTSFDDTPIATLMLTEKRLPSRIARIIARDAAANGELCPILHDVINPESSAVTTCFHVFDKVSIETWLQSNSTCPVCKERCSATPYSTAQRLLIDPQVIPEHGGNLEVGVHGHPEGYPE